MPDYLRMKRYEEDCDWAIAYVALPEIAYQPHVMARALHSPEHDLELAHWTFRATYPDLYERFTGIDTTKDDGYKVGDLLKSVPGERWDWVQMTKDGRAYRHLCPDQALAVFNEWLPRMRQAHNH